jgi:hypothetical protein
LKYIIRVIKIKGDETDGACGTYGDKRGGYWVLVGRSKGSIPLDLGVGGWVIFRLMLKNRMEDRGLDYYGWGWRQVAGCCECDNEISGYEKCGEILD